MLNLFEPLPASAGSSPVLTFGGTAGGPAGLPRRSPPARSSRLDSLHSNLNLSECRGPDSRGNDSLVVAVPCKCRSRTCDRCGPRLGWEVRQVMLGKIEDFRTPRVFTLTVDREHFSGPEDAHAKISGRSFIPRLMRLLGVRRWFWVLEFQMSSGQGWPHWHIVLDLADCGGQLDLNRAWHLWRNKWGLGGLDLGRKPPRSKRHAALYVTKYLTKMPPAFPPWVLLRGRVTRFCQASKLVGALTSRRRPSVRAELEDGQQLNLPFRAPRTVLLHRMARCERASVLFHFCGDVTTAKGEWKWAGKINADLGQLLDYSSAGLVSLRTCPIDFGEEGESVAILDSSIGGFISALRKIPAELADRECGHASAWAADCEDREWDLLDQHSAVWWENFKRSEKRITLTEGESDGHVDDVQSVRRVRVDREALRRAGRREARRFGRESVRRLSAEVDGLRRLGGDRGERRSGGRSGRPAARVA